MERKDIIEELKKYQVCEKYPVLFDDTATLQDEMDVISSLDGIEFIAEKEYPKPGILLERYGVKMLEDNCYFIKKVGKLDINEHKVKTHVIASDIDLYVPDYYVGLIFVSCKSNIRLYVGDFADVKIFFWETSRVELKESKEHSKVKFKIRHKHGI